MNTNWVIRDIKQNEVSFLDEMLYEAIYIPDGSEKLPFDIIKQPDLHKYIKDFGQPGDICLVAEFSGELVGAVWTRLFSEKERGYGYVDNNTPELSMAVCTQFRHKGIGTLLLQEIILKLQEQGYCQVSLSVDKQNYACHLYKSMGFETRESTDKSVIMIKKLNK
jgi:ribosomal protein S18 acetylase RimI-like enzyme